ncbi:MAG: hypothetical protein CSA33_03935 [Desulfobulbus propionicus]|nr:MAG: hypothetical protein CSA33_03935 [Desulfobulbus propionicus]
MILYRIFSNTNKQLLVWKKDSDHFSPGHPQILLRSPIFLNDQKGEKNGSCFVLSWIQVHKTLEFCDVIAQCF